MEIEEVKSAIREVMDERLKSFYIDRETHYQDHQFLKGLRQWTDSVRSTALKTMIGLIVAAIISLLVMGFVMWGRNHMK